MSGRSFTYRPSVIISRDGEKAVEIFSFEGSGPIPNRDAVGYYFMVRQAPGAEESRHCVLFSGTVLETVSPTAFGFPSTDIKDLNFVHFAEACIGDYLDKIGLTGSAPSASMPFQLECFSPSFKAWEEREAADDDVIEAYIRNRLFWSWRFNHDDVVFTTPDFLRLGVMQSDFFRVINIGKELDWKVQLTAPAFVILTPEQGLLRSERDRRRSVVPAGQPTTQLLTSQFVDPTRIDELRALKNTAYDLRRLIALCEELNVCSANNCVLAVAMLTRAIIDHVPPIFNAKTFAEVASSYPGAKSFKDSMQHLSLSARRIADAHLHIQIRGKEVLPTRTQVDFSRDLDVLLSEIVRILS